MMNLKVIEGGLRPKEKCEKSFISAYITDTRLMGAMGIYIHWEIIDSPETEDLHQFFYLDTEEYGFETYKSVWSDDTTEVETISHALIGCLGGSEVPVTLREVSSILREFVLFNEEHHLPLPEGRSEYSFLLNDFPPLSRDGSDKLFARICGPIEEEYQLINYFLMRCFGRDFTAAEYLSSADVKTDIYPDLPPLTLCKNTIDEKDGVFVCESLIETGNRYRILVSEIKIKDLKVIEYKKQSGFPISPQEAAMQLTRPEFITVYEVLDSPDGIENASLEMDFNTMVTSHENGKLFLAFNNNNDHVNKKVFRLSEDVFGLYYLTDFGQFLAASYSMSSIRRLERSLMHTSMGSYLIPTAKYEFKEPVLYDFIQSDFDDFDDFLDAIRDDD